MNRFLAVVFACLLASSPVLFASSVRAQAGFNDDRVMIQGFYWESHRHGNPSYPQFGSRKWYGACCGISG